MSNHNPIRRGQLIAPFGVGAMFIDKFGTGVVTAGLDYWFRREDGNDPSWDALDEFKVEEWRLERQLGVHFFMLPPDWREPKPGTSIPNPALSVPFLRFPTWHVCRRCQAMRPIRADHGGRTKCTEPRDGGECGGSMAQVQFVAVCEHGHLQDFPWNEWVHRDPQPQCQGRLRLTSTGGASLASQLVTCTACNKSRSLSNITSAERDEADGSYRTTLTTTLAKGVLYTCRGKRAWFGEEVDDQDCGQHLRGSLRSAMNVYFPDVRSAIYLPREAGAVSKELLAALSDPALSGVIQVARMTQLDPAATSGILVQNHPSLEVRFKRQEIEAAVRHLLQGAPLEDEEETFQEEAEFRYAEHQALRAPREEDDLRVRIEDNNSLLQGTIARVTLVEKLRETRVLNGFSRVNTASLSLEERRALMWKDPSGPSNNWLPAQVVYGEGIYLELDTAALERWESRTDVIAHIERLSNRADQVNALRGLPGGRVTPRYVLLHTLSHLLMNQLIFFCGYSSAALRERLYVSNAQKTPMAGILIYTAEGDADGTLGGLVRMGKRENFEPLVLEAISKAMWCSADPVCMEAGQSGGQGPEHLNLAACHNCALVPETACEAFNTLLDRTVVVGMPENPGLGFFGAWTDA
jgi:Domain of unknown function (DUF1998)